MGISAEGMRVKRIQLKEIGLDSTFMALNKDFRWNFIYKRMETRKGRGEQIGTEGGKRRTVNTKLTEGREEGSEAAATCGTKFIIQAAISGFVSLQLFYSVYYAYVEEHF